MQSRIARVGLRRVLGIATIVASVFTALSSCQFAVSPGTGWYDQEAFTETVEEEPTQRTQDEPGEEETEAEQGGDDEGAETPVEGDGTEDDPADPEDPEPTDPEPEPEPDPPAPPTEKSVTLAWDANVEPTVAGYRLYYGNESRTYGTTMEAGPATEITVEGLLVGQTYYFAVTAYDTEGRESDYSDEVSYTP